MLDLSMALDADLGIDSIKRVEILSALQERMPGLPQVQSEDMGRIATLQDVVDLLGATGGGETLPYMGAAGSDNNRGRGGVYPRPSAGTDARPSGDPSRVVQLLLEVVADTTGYPADMLDLSMALDADLGIDSIKRVEILSALQERLPGLPQVQSEDMGRIATLQDVVDLLGAAGGGEPLPYGEERPSTTRTPTSPVQTLDRYVLGLEPAGARRSHTWAPGATLWLAGDEELSARVAAALVQRGLRARTVALEPLPAAEGPLHGLVLIAPPACDDGFLLDGFALLQRAAGVLVDGALVMTVSRQDGRFGLSPEGPLDPVSGGLAGLVKTARHELPGVICRAVDLAADVDAGEEILAELAFAEPLELGVASDGRRRLGLARKAVEASDAPPLEPGEVVVISGGARGVTAEAALGLARFRPVLLLLGRSPLPEEEPAWMRGLATEAELKRALATRHRGTSPRELGERCRKLLAARELCRNLARIEAAGAQVLYRSCDVRDADAVAAAVAEARGMGPVRGLIHGAGVLADKRLVDKTREQFARVYGTKVDGLRALLAATAEDALRFCVVYSSSTARFGRTGQIDYAVANEVANKLAQREAARRPECRVRALGWGPWDGGMVTPGLRKLFLSEGVPPIPLDAGVAALLASLRAERAPVEAVLLGAGARLPDPLLGAARLAAPAAVLPRAFRREVSVASHPVLADHVMRGRAVVPLALISEWLAHGALHGQPGRWLHGLEELRVLRGLILDGAESRTVEVYAGPGRTTEEGLTSVEVELRSGAALHAGARVLLRGTPSVAAEPSLEPVRGSYPHALEEVYGRLLFHGPALHGIVAVEACSAEGIVARVRAAAPPAEWMQRPLRGRWIGDPLVLDCAFQAMILWSWENLGAPSLPTSVGRYLQPARSFPRDGARIVARVRRAGPGSATADIELRGADGHLLASLSDYTCVVDAGLAESFRANTILAGA